MVGDELTTLTDEESEMLVVLFTIADQIQNSGKQPL